MKDLFHKTNLLTNSAKIQSSYVIRNVIERMTIEHIPRSQALEMTMFLKSSYPNTCVAETPDSREASLMNKSGKRKNKNQPTPEPEPKPDTDAKEKEPRVQSKFALMVRENFNESVFLAKALNNEEEDKLRVLTIRSVETNGKLVCYLCGTWLLAIFVCIQYTCCITILNSLPDVDLFLSDVLVCSIAKVKTSHWEELLSALPLAHRGGADSNSAAGKNIIVPTAPSLASKSDKSSFGKRSTRIKKK